MDPVGKERWYHSYFADEAQFLHFIDMDTLYLKIELSAKTQFQMSHAFCKNTKLSRIKHMNGKLWELKKTFSSVWQMVLF